MNGQDIYKLAERCQVPIHAACKRAGIAPSTPWRWRERGMLPEQDSVTKLQAAILVIAEERGTLPADVGVHVGRERIAEMRQPQREPREIIRDIRRGLKELEQGVAP